MASIQDNDWFYNILHPYVSWRFRHSYRHIEYVGRENIPADGAIIYAPNHTNGLQDALAIVAMDKQPKVFVARADIFRKPRQARLLRKIKIMPIARIRDGIENVRKDEEVMEQAVDVLADGVPFCILPEGTHRSKHSLLPLTKGVFRIACMAVERLGDTKPVYIVPVGLEYGNYFRFRSSLLVNIGKPINVTQFIAGHPDLTLPQIYNELRDMLTEALQGQILWIPDDEMYDATLESCYLSDVMNPELLPALPETQTVHTESRLLQRIRNDQEMVSRMLSLRRQSPEQAAELCRRMEEIAIMRRTAGICVESVQTKNPIGTIIGRILLLVLLFPYFVICGVVTLPVWLTVNRLLRRLKDPSFYTSFQCALTIFILPVCFLTVAVLLFVLLPWYWALAVFVGLLPSNIVFHEYLRQYRLLRSDIRLWRFKELRRKITDLKNNNTKRI